VAKNTIEFGYVCDPIVGGGPIYIYIYISIYIIHYLFIYKLSFHPAFLSTSEFSSKTHSKFPS